MPTCAACYRKSRLKTREKKRRLKGRYGLTVDEYHRLLESQGGACAICRKAGSLHVDHDHESGKVRGALCSTCNSLIGFSGESLLLLKRASDYLLKYRK